MRQLLPVTVDDVDPAELYALDDRPRRAERPWLLANMIASVDGATAVGGVSGPLGGPADKRVFSAIRGVADVILVAAGTVRAEAYGPPRPSAQQRARRSARGQRAAPRLAICTASLDLDLTSPLFTESAERPLVLTVDAAEPGRVAAATAVAEVVVAGDTTVDVRRALDELGARGADIVLAEGGPSLTGQLVAAGLVDELCLTVAPLLVAGPSSRIARSSEAAVPATMRLARVLEDGGTLFLRYLSDAAGASAPSPS